MAEARCGVCGREVTAEDFRDPPTWTLDPTGRPVLNKPIRMDPETGAICWCPEPEPAGTTEGGER